MIGRKWQAVGTTGVNHDKKMGCGIVKVRIILRVLALRSLSAAIRDRLPHLPHVHKPNYPSQQAYHGLPLFGEVGEAGAPRAEWWWNLSLQGISRNAIGSTNLMF